MSHRPTGGVTILNMKDMFPADMLADPIRHFMAYGEGGPASVAAYRKVNADPTALVTIYRAQPESEGTTIETGDWVGIAHEYAHAHAEHVAPEGEAWVILAAQVPAHTIETGGNDLMEWGFFGEDITGTVVERHTFTD